MNSSSLKQLASLYLVFCLLFLSGCAGSYPPPAPLWDSSLYDTVAVLPVRMTISTGRPPFTTEDTELSGTMGGKMQEALSIVIRYKGYEVLSPDDLSERLMEEEDLSEAFISLASSQGLMGPDQKAPWEEGMAGAALIADKLGADLLVVGHGQGEYHSASENLVQSLVTGLLSKGKEQYNAPPSFLEADISFIDPASGTRIARFPPQPMSYQDKIIPLSKSLDRFLRRVPEKQNVEQRIENVEEIPNP